MVSLYALYMMLSALAFAGLDLIRKLLAGRIAPLVLVMYMSLGAVPIMSVLLLRFGVGPLSWGYVLPGLGALSLNFTASLGFIHALKISPLSRTIPLLSLTPVFTALTAVPLLGETPSTRQAFGILLVVAGAVALNVGAERNWARGLMKERGAHIMTGVALLWSLSGPLDKLAIGHASVYFHATVMSLGVGLGALTLLWARRRLAELRLALQFAPLLCASMAAITLALVFQLLAISGILVSLVESVKRATGSLASLLLGRWFFEERIDRVQIVAVCIMAAGVFLLMNDS